MRKDVVLHLPYHVPVLWRDHRKGEESFAFEVATLPVPIRYVPLGDMWTMARADTRGVGHSLALMYEGDQWGPVTSYGIRSLAGGNVRAPHLEILRLHLSKSLLRTPQSERPEDYVRTHAVERVDREAAAWAARLAGERLIHDGSTLLVAIPFPGSPADEGDPLDKKVRSALGWVLSYATTPLRSAAPDSALATNAHLLRRLALRGMVGAIPEAGLPSAAALVRETAGILSQTLPAANRRKEMARIVDELDGGIPADDQDSLLALSP